MLKIINLFFVTRTTAI